MEKINTPSSLDLQKLENFSTNSKNYFGTDKNDVLSQYAGLPFAPFNRLDNFIKCCDFSITNHKNAQVTTKAAQQPEDFIEIEQSQQKKPTGYRKTYFPNSYKPQPKNARNDRHYQNRVQQKSRPQFNEAVQNRNWEFLVESQKANIEKTKVNKVTCETFMQTGFLQEFDKSLNKFKNEKVLNSSEARLAHPKYSSTLADPVFQNIIIEDGENGVSIPTVYTTDTLLSAMMSMKKAEFPFEIKVTKEGQNQYIFDKLKEDKLTYLEMSTINENASELLPRDERELQKLCSESTQVQKQFINQSIANGEQWDFGKGNPNEVEGSTNKPIGYQYVSCNIDGKMIIKVRVSIDTFIKNDAGEKKSCLIKTLNEYDLSTDWRKKLQSGGGSLASLEILNNICNLSKWLCVSQIAKINDFQIAYISRQKEKDSSKHSILKVDHYTYQDFASIISFNMNPSWQIVKYFVEYLIKQQEGTYVLVKNAFKNSIRIYSLPEDDEEEEESDK